MDSISDRCVACTRKVSARQHALLCDGCNRWQHRICDTGISQREYRDMIRSEITINFTCTICKRNEEETIRTTLEIMDQGSQRGKRKLVSSDGYEFVKKVSKGDFTYWRCSKRSKTVNCPATISQKGDTFKANSRAHIHQADKGALKKVQVWKEVKSQCVQDIHKPARRVVEDAMLDLIEEDDHQLPNVRNLQRLANRIREDLRPAEPRDLEFIIDTDYLQCQDFLVGDIHVDTERHLVFSTPNQLRILQQARRWFCDGTFKILARPFQQLWSIHAFVCRGDSYKQVPLVFCLMSRRKSRDYAAIFKKLKEIIPGVPQVQTFVVDFEKGAWKAIREEFPNTLIKGCAFHFGQAVWRKVQELGLRTTYTKRGAEYRYIRSLMALPFLPSADIQPAFDRLSARATSQELQQLVAYMDSNWIGSAVWQPRNWSIFQTNVRTNNDVEGWHTRINADIGKANAAFYILVPALQREARLVDLTVRLVSEEQILRCQRRRYQDLTCRLHEAWDRYTNGELTASQLLRECGGVYGPNND
ncbi:uncharacterized protein LOC133186965 [Saccostrea echinata]|uniref:uncharacterized protein LOC133186965 n=1 Tax=Saccostrea echinata TaxID=191078 RepID=UPI002A81AE7C|nr:uncharacterized protein LOC133186965 [Saccostrea echinata]